MTFLPLSVDHRVSFSAPPSTNPRTVLKITVEVRGEVGGFNGGLVVVRNCNGEMLVNLLMHHSFLTVSQWWSTYWWGYNGSDVVISICWSSCPTLMVGKLHFTCAAQVGFSSLAILFVGGFRFHDCSCILILLIQPIHGIHSKRQPIILRIKLGDGSSVVSSQRFSLSTRVHALHAHKHGNKLFH